MNHKYNKLFFYNFHITSLCFIAFLLCVLLALSGCSAGKKNGKDTVWKLECIKPVAFSSVFSAGDSKMVINCADYDKGITTLQLVDALDDAVLEEVTVDGIWDLKEQTFSDGRFAICNRETNEWKFLSSSLKDIGAWDAENVDGYFSYDASTYYYIKDDELCWKNLKSGEGGKLSTPLDLRISSITSYEAESGKLLMQFLLSPYSSDCGTAIYNIDEGTLEMLQEDRYQMSFNGGEICMLTFDNDKMGYSALYENKGKYYFADADIFSENSGYVFTIEGSPFLMGIKSENSTLYQLGKSVSSCDLSELGVNGEMHSVCYLTDAKLLVGAVYKDGAFHFYRMDPEGLPFTELGKPDAAKSPMVVDDELAKNYWGDVYGSLVANNLKEARKYADKIEEKYGVKILLSSQCKETAAFCEYPIDLTDTMDETEEVKNICRMLEALDRSLGLYPKGFTEQFRNSRGDGGLCFLIVGHIETGFGAEGVTYERYGWQYIALDSNQTFGLEGIVCHELWHATENYILSRDYTAFTLDKWSELNPKGFAYYQDATQTDPNQKWTLYNSAIEDIYFVDSYACVDQKEDRARIMEFIMAYEDESKVLIKSPHIRKKLEIMCSAVRNTFDTSGWKDVRWERLL